MALASQVAKWYKARAVSTVEQSKQLTLDQQLNHTRAATMCRGAANFGYAVDSLGTWRLNPTIYIRYLKWHK
jgi:hypothetical protein